MSLAARAAGADGILVEVHCNPAEALCDGDQSQSPAMFASMMDKLRRLDVCMKEIELSYQRSASSDQL
jgi:3-deoxy-7-phosphoheptulonate synthase